MILSSTFHRNVVALFREIVLVFCIVLTCNLAVAAPPTPQSPDTETHSLIIGIDAGTAPAAKTDRKAALAGVLNRGRQTVLEKARNRLIELGKFGLDFDFIRSATGFVQFLRQEETLSRKDDRPHLWLEAETGFVLKDRKTGGRPDSELLRQAGLLDVRIWTDRKEYEEGKAVTLHLQGNQDFYGKVVRIDMKGNVCQILPNNYRQMSSFEKDRTYRIPDEGDRYQLSVHPPFGTIRFIVYATRLPLSQVNLQTTTGGIFKYRASQKAFGRSVRHIIPAGEEQMAEFCEASWEIRTLSRK
jgi:hypothetical protein